jgi:hypothetical protein
MTKLFMVLGLAFSILGANTAFASTFVCPKAFAAAMLRGSNDGNGYDLAKANSLAAHKNQGAVNKKK